MFKKIIEWFKNFKFLRKIKRTKIEPRGYSLLNYMIRRYLNEYDEYDEEFEKVIDYSSTPEGGTRIMVIAYLIATLFCIIEADKREIWYNLIDDVEIREGLRKTVNETVEKW